MARYKFDFRDKVSRLRASTAKPGASSHNKNMTTNCEFFGSQSGPDGTTFSIDGTVTGMVTK